MNLAQEQRQRLLDDAITAMRAYVEHDPRTEPSDWPKLREEHHPVHSRLAREASKAVTAAVTKGGHIHTLITLAVRCTGMRVVAMIDDRDARDRALLVEQNAAENYLNLVKEQLRAAAVGRAAGGYGDVSYAAERFGVTRKTIYAWAADAGVDLVKPKVSPS